MAVDFWEDLLAWAIEAGWEPERAPDFYRSETGIEVSADDADNLADAMEHIAGDFALTETQVPEKFLRELVDGLRNLTRFFKNGEFHINDVPAGYVPGSSLT